MTSFSRALCALSLVTSIALIGAGCSKEETPAQNAPVPPVNTTPGTTTQPSTQPTTPSTSTPITSTDGGTISTSSTLDTTGWQTYENKTLKFSFKYPLRGSFAPKFDITLLPLTSSNIENDCFKAPSFPDTKQARVTVNGTPFCTTSYSEGAAGTIYLDQQWVTKQDNWYAVIHFTKNYANTAERTFDVNGYQRQIEAIMSTFTLPPSA